MSRTWMRATVPMLCGGPDHDGVTPIQVGEPMLVIAGSGWRKIRCAQCADVPVPKTLALLEDVTVPATLAVVEADDVPLRHGSPVPLDQKQRGSGEREPGCDDE